MLSLQCVTADLCHTGFPVSIFPPPSQIMHSSLPHGEIAGVSIPAVQWTAWPWENRLCDHAISPARLV